MMTTPPASSFSPFRVCVRTAVLVALPMLLVAGQAWGQMSTMSTRLIEDANVNVPVDSSTIYPESRFTLTGGGQALFGDASVLDNDGDGNIDGVHADLDGEGSGTVGVVDWVIVELRFVATGANIPTNRSLPDEGNEDRSVSKTGLLLSDGSIVDASDPNGGLLSFEDVDFDVTTQDVYVVVDHRNHRAVMSSVALTTDDEGVLQYDFSDAATKAVGSDLRNRAGIFVMALGDANVDNNVNVSDLDEAINQIAEGAGYRTADFNFNTLPQVSDIDNLLNTGFANVSFVR